MADLSNATLPLDIKALIRGAYADDVYFQIDGVSEKVTLAEILEWLSENGGSGSSGLSTYDVGNQVTVTGSAGITTTKSGGEIDIILPENGILVHGYAYIRPGDATYSNGIVSDAVKLTIDNSANGLVHSILPRFMALTGGLPVSPGNPLQFNTAINNDMQIDEFGTDTIGWVFQQISTRASAGGYIFF